jgi:hypothetical protein
MAALLADPDREEHPVGPDMVALLADSGTQVVRVDKEELLEGSPGEVAYNLDHLDSGLTAYNSPLSLRYSIAVYMAHGYSNSSYTTFQQIRQSYSINIASPKL